MAMPGSEPWASHSAFTAASSSKSELHDNLLGMGGNERDKKKEQIFHGRKGVFYYGEGKVVMLAIFAEHEFQTRARGSKRGLLVSLCGLLCVVGQFSAVAYGKDVHSTFDVKVSGSGPAVILIPGLSCSGVIWEETVKHLQDRFECHVLSLKGLRRDRRLSLCRVRCCRR